MEIKKTRTPICAEWDRLVTAVNGDNGAMHWREMYSWCQDDIANSRTCVIRGYCNPGHWHRGNPVLRAACTGFRPTFEVDGADRLAVGRLVLVGALYMDVVLCHYPMPCFKNHFLGWYHLYGHVHSSFEANMTEHDKMLLEELCCNKCNMFNVGAMVPWMDYTPRTLEEIEERSGMWQQTQKA